MKLFTQIHSIQSPDYRCYFTHGAHNRRLSVSDKFSLHCHWSDAHTLLTIPLAVECDNLSIKISQNLFASVKFEWWKSVVAMENFNP